MLKNLNRGNNDVNISFSNKEIIQKLDNIKNEYDQKFAEIKAQQLESKKELAESRKSEKIKSYTLLISLIVNALVLAINFYNGHLDRMEKREEQRIKIEHDKQVEIENNRKEKYLKLDNLAKEQNGNYKLVDELINQIELTLTSSNPNNLNYDSDFQRQIIKLISLKPDWILIFGNEIIPDVSEYTQAVNVIESKILSLKGRVNPKDYLNDLKKSRNKLEDSFSKRIIETKKERDKYDTIDYTSKFAAKNAAPGAE